jgi:MerR family transcriptional regulator, light-induced transcriptional regulator
MRDNSSTMSVRGLTLQEVSQQLSVHYMTAYRWVRTGRLAAAMAGGVWEVDVGDLERFVDGRGGSPGGRGHPDYPRRVPAFVDRLVAADERGGWLVVEAVLAGGASASDVYSEVFAPALRLLGERWSRGEISVADEHGATVIIQRLIGRLGPLFRRPGRSRGAVLLGAPEGEFHSLPTAIAADLLRAQRYHVVDLGANVPTDSFVDCAKRLPRIIAVGVAVTTPGPREVVARLVSAHIRTNALIPIIVGGSGIGEAEARESGASLWTASVERLVEALSARS